MGSTTATCPYCGAASVERVIARYDEIVRANQSPEWNTVVAVATCDEGLYGAFGEVLDVATEMGCPNDDAFVDELEAAFSAYQARLRDEIAGIR
jgi:predicted molibdopterin-dependent oxidoreductase YjgC